MNQKQAETLKWCTDACARCGHINKPWHIRLKRKGYVAADYQCGKCPYSWVTTWELNFAIEHALDVKYLEQHSHD